MRTLIKKHSHSSLKRFVASALIVFLLIDPVVIASSHTTDKNHSAFKIEFPRNLGSVEESWTANPRKTVIFIQDAHDSLEAQENIAAMIHYSVDRYGVKTVYEEGFEGPVPTDKYFGKIKDPEVRKKTAYFLMDKLRIGGAEYAHITRKKDFQLMGADNFKLHKKNIEWYQESAANKSATEKDLGVMDASIRKLAARYFTKDIKEWMSLKERFDAHQIDLLGYLRRITSLSKKSAQLVAAGAYPNISLLLRSEKSNDPAIFEKVKSMEGKALFEEMGRLEDEYAGMSLADTRGKMIFDYYKTLQLLKRLNAIEVTEEEYESVKEKLKALDTAEIARFIAEQNGKSIVLSRSWEKHIQSAMEFYETSRQRDLSIQPLLKDYLKRAGNEPAVLVYGGFHKGNIKKILKENNISYKIVTPGISSVSAKHQAYYKKIMRMGYQNISLPVALPSATRPPSLLVFGESGDIEIKSRVGSIIDQATDIAASGKSFPEMDLEWARRRTDFYHDLASESNPRSETRSRYDTPTGIESKIIRVDGNSIDLLPLTKENWKIYRQGIFELLKLIPADVNVDIVKYVDERIDNLKKYDPDYSFIAVDSQNIPVAYTVGIRSENGGFSLEKFSVTDRQNNIFRRQGIGTWILYHTLANAKEKGLFEAKWITTKTNGTANPLYQKIGMRRSEEIPPREEAEIPNVSHFEYQGSIDEVLAKLQKVFEDSKKPRSEVRQTLTDILGRGEIKNVFEFASGDGTWLTKLKKTYAFPWLDSDPVLAGFELPEPVYYADYGFPGEAEMVAAFKEKWRRLSERGIQIYTQESEIPNIEFDLLHVAFQPHDPDDLVFSKLSRFEKRLRLGGWVVFANDENIIQRSEINRWLIEHGYRFNEIHVFSNSEIPKDYPFSTWGEIQSKHTRYLIVAQKPLYRSELRQNDDSEMRNLLIDALRQEAEDWGVNPDVVMAHHKFHAFLPFTLMVSYDADNDVTGIAIGKDGVAAVHAYLVEEGGKHMEATGLANGIGIDIKLFKTAGDVESDSHWVVGQEKEKYFLSIIKSQGDILKHPMMIYLNDWIDPLEVPRSEARAGKIMVDAGRLREIVDFLNEARSTDKRGMKSLKVRVKKEVKKIDPAKQSQLEAILLMSVTSANELADGEEWDVHIMRGALERLNAQISEGRIEYVPRQGTFTLIPASTPVEKKKEPRDEVNSKEILSADFVRESRFFKQGVIQRIYKSHQRVKHIHVAISAEKVNSPGLVSKFREHLNRAGDELVYLTLKVRFPEETRYISILDTATNLNKYTVAEILDGKDAQGETLLNQFELLLSVSEYQDAFHLRLISVGNEAEYKKVNGDYKNHAEILQGEGYGKEIFSEMAKWFGLRAAEKKQKMEISTIDGSTGKWTAKRMQEFFGAEPVTRKGKRHSAISKREEILPGNKNDVWAGWITPEHSPRSEARLIASTKQQVSQNVVFVDGAAEYQNPQDVAEELAILASNNPKQKVIVYNMRLEAKHLFKVSRMAADLKSFDLSNVQFVEGSLAEAARPYQYRENLDLVYYGNEKDEAVKAIQELGAFSKRVTYFVGKPGALGYGLKYLPAVKLSKRVENLILQNGYYVVSPQASEWMRSIQQAQFVTIFARSA